MSVTPRRTPGGPLAGLRSGITRAFNALPPGPARRWIGWSAALVILLAGAGGAVAAVRSPGVPQPAPPGASTGGSGSGRTASPVAVVFNPASGSTGVSVTTPVSVSTVDATLVSVVLVDAKGGTVPGAFDSGRHAWHSSQPLDYRTTYTITATAAPDSMAAAGGTAVTSSGFGPLSAAGSGGSGTAGGSGTSGESGSAAGSGTSGATVTAAGGPGQIQRTSTFTTVRPSNLTLPYLRANAGLLLSARQTFGVGQVIEVWFDEPIPDKAAAQRALSVTTSPHVDGAWHWFGDQEVHWRPQSYWQPGTQVTVAAHVYGVNLGNGLYGQANSSASFRIGDSHVAIADDHTFQIEVYINGKLVRTVPTAMGLHSTITSSTGQVIDLRTHSGVHVVLGNAQVVQMNSASYGLTGPGSYNEPVYWTTHISYSGEYIHAAPWSVAQQGHADASHGCLNVNTTNAIWFYNTFIPGDIVDVRNTGVMMSPTNGLGDWNLSWSDWVKGSALPVTTAATGQPVA